MSSSPESLPHDQGEVYYSAIEVQALREEAYAQGFYDANNAIAETENETIKSLRQKITDLKNAGQKRLIAKTQAFQSIYGAAPQTFVPNALPSLPTTTVRAFD